MSRIDGRQPCAALARRALLARLGMLGAWGAAGAWPRAALALGDPAEPLCGRAPPPPYPAADQRVVVQTWVAGGRRDGPPPDCSGLSTTDVELLLLLTASYRSAGDLNQQLARFGAVSRLKGMQYWSFSDRRRQTLIPEAHAVQSLASLQPRADFSVAELKSGAPLSFVHNDNRTSALVPYQMRLLRHGADGFTLRVENIGEIAMFGLTLVASHEMQWTVTVERLSAGLWGYRGMLALHRLRLGGVDQHRLSNLSRAAAMFDLVAGRQTDVEPYR